MKTPIVAIQCPKYNKSFKKPDKLQVANIFLALKNGVVLSIKKFMCLLSSSTGNFILRQVRINIFMISTDHS